MSVFGIIIAILLIIFSGFCIVKNVIAIIDNIKQKKVRKQVDLLKDDNKEINS